MNGPKGIMTNFDEEGGEKTKGQKRKLEESNGDGAENNENGNGVHNGLVLFRLLLKLTERVHFMKAKSTFTGFILIKVCNCLNLRLRCDQN